MWTRARGSAWSLVSLRARRRVVIAGVRKAFGDVVALDGVSLRVAAHEVVAVVGPSGCGKSTLLELVCGLQRPDAGEVQSPPAALMPQRDVLLPWLSALDNAGAGAARGGRVRARPRGGARTALRRASASRASSARGRASCRGGMRQRVAFLRTLLAGRAGAVPGRAVRRARRDHARAGAGVAGRRARARAAHRAARHARRRGGGRCSPTASWCSRRGPAASSTTLEVDLAAPARAHRPAVVALRARGARRARRRRLMAAAAARARAARRLGGARARRRRRRLLLPAPTEIAEALWSDRALLGRRPRWSPPRRSCSGSPRRSSPARRWRVAMHLSRRSRRALHPLVVGSQAVPIPIVAPLLVLVLGFGLAPKLVIVALVCFFPVVVNARRAARRRPRRSASCCARSAPSRWQPLRCARGARRAARRAHRREDRRRRRRDRRRVRRVRGLRGRASATCC